MIKRQGSRVIYITRFQRSSLLRVTLSWWTTEKRQRVGFESVDTVRLVEGRGEKYGKRGRASTVQRNGSGQTNLFLGKLQPPDQPSLPAVNNESSSVRLA